MVTLFQVLAEEAGIIANGPKKRGRTQKAILASVGAAKTRTTTASGGSGKTPPPPPPPTTTDLAGDPAITGVLTRLPATQKRSAKERQRWFRALEGAVDLLVVVEEDNAGGATEKA